MLFEYLKWAGQRQNFGRWGSGSDPLRPPDVLRWNPVNSNSSGQRAAVFVRTQQEPPFRGNQHPTGAARALIQQNSHAICRESAFCVDARAGSDRGGVIGFRSELLFQRGGQLREVGALPPHHKSGA